MFLKHKNVKGSNQTGGERLGNLACILRQTKGFGLRLMKLSQYHRKTHSF